MKTKSGSREPKPTLTTTSSTSTKARLLAGFIGFILAALIIACFLAPHVFARRSVDAAFQRIKLTMPKSEVEQILTEAGISCRWPDATGTRPMACEFSDFWREYRIAVDRKTNQVDRKSFGFKRSRSIALR
jgi:hypothetical protein